jgi:hypothetical protein
MEANEEAGQKKKKVRNHGTKRFQTRREFERAYLGCGVRRVRVHTYRLCNERTATTDLFHSNESFGRRPGD